MCWEVRYLEDIEKWLDGLGKEQRLNVLKELRLLEYCGNVLKLPHSRSLGRGLFELRERKYHLRLYYGFDKNKIIVVLCAGNKKTQNKNIKKHESF
jgi:putative addiction module killer protein